MKISGISAGLAVFLLLAASASPAEDFPKPYSAPCVERENVFAFTRRPEVKLITKDRYEITFAVKGYCDVTVGIVDEDGTVVRHLASGVLGKNAPAPLQRNSLAQKLYWNGKDDLDAYPKEPEKLKVRVALGLKPEFERRLGPTSPYAMPGLVWGVAADPEGVYVGSVGARGRLFLRKFDHDGKYVKTVLPPPDGIPEEKLGGYSFVEYERGVRALHGPGLNESLTSDGLFHYAFAGLTTSCRPAISKGRLYYTNNGRAGGKLQLYWLKTDGSGDVAGQATGTSANQTGVGLHSTWDVQLAASPDGRWVYMVVPGGRSIPCVFRGPDDCSATMKVIVGDPRRKPGSGPGELGSAQCVDVDAKGRIYVADSQNNAVKIFSPEGKFLKAIPADRPKRVAVHQKTGAIYVSHQIRVQGKSVGRVTKFSSFDDPKAEKRLDGPVPMVMIVDSWASRPRLWMAAPTGRDSNNSLAALALCGRGKWGPAFVMYEETDKEFRKALDFAEEVGRSYPTDIPFIDIWRGSASHDSKVICDPTRQEAYYGMSPKFRFDLKTGRLIDRTELPGFDHGFDKHGYVHCHFGPGTIQGVGRLDPSQEEPSRKGAGVRRLREVPYDYGVPPVSVRGGTARGWIGVIHTKDQSGAQAFLDGMGVNMRGDVAENCNVFYVPKMEDIGREAAAGGIRRAGTMGGDNLTLNRYASFMQGLADLERKGEAIYFIKRGPGRPLSAATIWTFDRTGELRAETAAVVGDRIDGVQIDEDGCIYFVTARLRMRGERHFLRGRGGIYGNPKAKPQPLTGTLVKGRPNGVEFRLAGAPVRMEPLPDRPPDLIHADFPVGFDSVRNRCWVENAEWFYAGASSIVFTNCECPTMRFSTDWYRRTFVPEVYRHSIGVLDTAGNLVLHIGRYGNADSDGITAAHSNKVSTTDDYMVFDDCGERLTVLKLSYHVEETVGIDGR